MIAMTDEMRDLVDNAMEYRTPCIVGTVDPEGGPHVGFRGSVMVFDDEHLAWWERTMRGEASYLQSNPKVVVLLRNPEKRVGWKFYGSAVFYRDGPLREQVMARTPQVELDRDAERKGFAVLIKVDLITTLGGQSIQERDGEASSPSS